jgi:hypothetical protein
METLNLNKRTYAKSQYQKVIDTNFNQLAQSPSVTNPNVIVPIISVEEFFSNYIQIFFNIPKLGATNSHEYLAKTSLEYIGTNPVSDEINALIDEINILQQQNLELNQQIIDLQLPK